jgi:hypothetical protein
MGMRGSFSSKIHVCSCGTKSGAFSETTEGALFLPGAKDENPPPTGGFPTTRRPTRLPTLPFLIAL